MESSSFHGLSFPRVKYYLELDHLYHQFIPDSNYKSKVHNENPTFERNIALDSTSKSNSNISILNQIMSYPKSGFSISSKTDSFGLDDCVSNDNLLNDSIYSPPTKILGDKFEYQTKISHTPKIQVCVVSKFHDLKEHK